MAGSSGIHHELAALKAELGKTSAPPRKSHPEAVAHEAAIETVDQADKSFASDFEEQMKDLGEALSAYTGSAEDFIAEHPLACVLAAFVLGIAAGRMMGRT